MLIDAITSQMPPLQPHSALVFHTRGSALELLTYHTISHLRGKPLLSDGRPLSPEEEQAILRQLTSSDTAAPIELFPANLLCQDRDQIVWFVPPAARPMHFHVGSERSQRDVTWPGLVFRVTNHRLFLAAYEGAARPALDTPLFKAPLANIWANGECCTGDAPLPEASRVAEIASWEAVIFQSAFSHQNDPSVIRKGRGFVDPMEFWRENDRVSPKALVPLNRTLGGWLAAPVKDR